VHRLGDLRWIAVSIVATAVAVLLAFMSPQAIVVLIALIVWVLIARFKPSWMFHLTLITAFLAVPSFVPRVVSGFFLYEPTLLGCVAVSLLRRQGRAVQKTLLTYVGVCIFAVLLGIYVRNPAGPIQNDLRPMFGMVLGVIAGANALRFTRVKSLVRTSQWIIWVSLGMTLAGSFGFVELVGRSEVASLVGATAGADRLITPATFFALATACGAVAALVSKAAPARTLVSLAVPSLAIIFLSFSRNNIMALCVAIVWVLVAAGPASRKFAGIGRLLSLAVAGAVAITSVLALFEVPWLREQLDGFGSRVLGGLSSSAIQQDGSAQYRVEENNLILPVIAESPFWGHGFGAAYRTPYGPADYFTATTAPYYAHQYYFWLMLKGGAVLLTAFATLTLRPVLVSLRGHRPRLAVVSAVLVAFLVVSFVAPMPNGFPTGLLFGLIVGLAHRLTADTPTPDLAKSPELSKALPDWAIQRQRLTGSLRTF
jgi:hypothetical protein